MKKGCPAWTGHAASISQGPGPNRADLYLLINLCVNYLRSSSIALIKATLGMVLNLRSVCFMN